MDDNILEIKDYVDKKLQENLDKMGMNYNQFKALRNDKSRSEEIRSKLKEDPSFALKWIPTVIYYNLNEKLFEITIDDLPF